MRTHWSHKVVNITPVAPKISNATAVANVHYIFFFFLLLLSGINLSRSMGKSTYVLYGHLCIE